MIDNKNQQLTIDYEKANETDSFKVHNDFLNSLLSDSSEKGMELHYSFFQDTSNSDLKRILGKGFLKRGESGLEFLVQKLKVEKDSLKKSNIIHLIGLSYNKKYLPYIIPYLKDTDEDVRYKAIVAIGWLGDSSTINVLENNFDIEKENLLRGFTITAMRQIYFRNPDTKESILSFILNKIKIESDEEVLAIMIAVIQDLTKTKFGLKEDPNTGEISGDIVKSKEKIIKKLIHE